MNIRFTALFLVLSASIFSFAQSSQQEIFAPPPQRLVIHSKVLNEDRTMWVRVPAGYSQSKSLYPVLYETDAPTHVIESGAAIDFLVANARMPEMIVVGITNTDRTRDLTPTNALNRNSDGTTTSNPTSGGADKFLEFIKAELMPEVEKRYRAAPYRVFAGHSLGGLLAVYALTSHPDMFDAYVAVSPSLWWDDGKTLRQAEQFLTSHPDLKKTLFFSLASEGNTPNPMSDSFEEFRRFVAANAPKGLNWRCERFPDEDHGSTVMMAHYAGLRTVFADWQVPKDPTNGMPIGGLAGVEQHYRELSKRMGYNVPIPENLLNNLGYQLVGQKKFDEGIAVFQRNTQLYPESANVYDSLGEGLETAGKYEQADANFHRAVEIATKTGDSNLGAFKDHVNRVAAEMKTAAAKDAAAK
jgi:uncharacterized protein